MKKKTIQVILNKTIPQLGEKGNLIKAKSGYIRNYLIPLKLVKIATPELIEQVYLREKELAIKQKQLMEKYIKLKETLENLEKFIIKKKISDNGKFFGKITKQQILELIKNKISGTIDLNTRQIQLPIMKELGSYIISIILTTNVIAKIHVKILPK